MKIRKSNGTNIESWGAGHVIGSFMTNVRGKLWTIWRYVFNHNKATYTDLAVVFDQETDLTWPEVTWGQLEIDLLLMK